MNRTCKDRLPFTIQLPLVAGQADFDENGRVHPWVYLRWLEDLRRHLITQYWAPDQHPSKRVGSVLTSTQIEYKQSLQHRKPWVGRMWVIELGRTRWVMKAEICCDRASVATAIQTGVQMDWITQQPIFIPEELVTAYWESQWNLQRSS